MGVSHLDMRRKGAGGRMNPPAHISSEGGVVVDGWTSITSKQRWRVVGGGWWVVGEETLQLMF